MKLIIDIPEKVNEHIRSAVGHGYYPFFDDDEGHIVGKAISNGTPLPKGYGRLIDADALEKLCYEHEIGNSAFDGEPIIAQGKYDDGDSIWKSLFDFAPTIIEADMESEDKE